MIIKEDNELRFVLESKENFIFENDEKALAAIEIDDGKKAYVSVEKYHEQHRVEIHPRFVIPGKAAFSAYEALATSDDGLFGTYINPSKGEVMVVANLEAATAGELDRVIDEGRRVLKCAWDILDFYARAAAKQSSDDKDKFKSLP